MNTKENRINNTFRQHGYKLTPQRRAVIASISRSREHMTPAEIHERLQTEHPGIGLVTVYRTLEILDELGLICETRAGGNCRSYMVRSEAAHHHHLICSECGRVTDFTDCELGELEKRLTAKTRYVITGHLLEFTGMCRDCQRNQRRAKSTLQHV